MNNFDYITKENIKEHNPNLPHITDHKYKILITVRSESRKTNALFDLIGCQPDIDKIYLYAKDPNESKYQLLINKCGGAGLKHCNNSKTLIDYSNGMDDIYENVEEYNPDKERKILIVFDKRNSDILSNTKLNPILTELFIRGRKLNIYLGLLHNLTLLYQKILD